MLLPELQQLAAGMGIDTAKMRKGDLVATIQARRAGGARDGSSAASAPPAAPSAPPADGAPAQPAVTADAAPTAPSEDGAAGRQAQPRRQPAEDRQRHEQQRRAEEQPRPETRQEPARQQQPQGSQPAQTAPSGQAGQRDDDDFDGGRRRGRRYRDRRGRNRDRIGERAGGSGGDTEPVIAEDDVLVPVAGILDTIEEKNAWFIRTGGYFASPEDVYVANSYAAGSACVAVTPSPVPSASRAKASGARSTTRWSGWTPSTAATRSRPRDGSSSPSSPRSTHRSGCAWRPSRASSPPASSTSSCRSARASAR